MGPWAHERFPSIREESNNPSRRGSASGRDSLPPLASLPQRDGTIMENVLRQAGTMNRAGLGRLSPLPMHARPSTEAGPGRSGMTIPPAAGPKAPPSAGADSKPPGNRRTLSGATIVIWAVIAALGILFSVFAVAIGLQAATFDVMRWLLALAIEAPLAAGIIALIWYSRNMHSATAAGEAGAQALAHSEAKYQELIASAPDGIFVLDPQAKVI